MAKSDDHIAYFKSMANDPDKFKSFKADPHGAMKAAGLDHTAVSDEHAAAMSGGGGTGTGAAAGAAAGGCA